MPAWFIAMPSQMPMVANSSGVPPAMRTPALTASATLRRFRCPGMTSFAELTTAMSGREISSSVRPSALSRLRCGAFEGPVFMRSLRSSIPLHPSLVASGNGGCVATAGEWTAEGGDRRGSVGKRGPENEKDRG